MGGQIDETQRRYGAAPLIDAIHRRAGQKVMRDKALAWCFDSEASRKEVKRVSKLPG